LFPDISELNAAIRDGKQLKSPLLESQDEQSAKEWWNSA